MKPTTKGNETSKPTWGDRVRVWWANWKNRRVAKAYKTLTQAMREDPSYAISWQSNIAMPIYDWARSKGKNVTHQEANEIGDLLMNYLFGVPSVSASILAGKPVEVLMKPGVPTEPGMYFARQYRSDSHYRYIVLVWGEAPFLSVKAVFDLIHGKPASSDAHCGIIYGPRIEERHVPPGEVQPRSGF